MSTVTAQKTFFHVLQSKGDYKWHIKRDNRDIPVAYDSKEEAIEKVMYIAEAIKGRPRQVIVHKALKAAARR